MAWSLAWAAAPLRSPRSTPKLILLEPGVAPTSRAWVVHPGFDAGSTCAFGAASALGANAPTAMTDEPARTMPSSCRDLPGNLMNSPLLYDWRGRGNTEIHSSSMG